MSFHLPLPYKHHFQTSLPHNKLSNNHHFSIYYNLITLFSAPQTQINQPTTTIMQFSKTIIAALLSATCISAAAAPDYARFARDLEAEVMARHLQDLGLSTREEHPNPAMVKREVDAIMSRETVAMFKRMPHVDCSTLLTHCTYNTECSMKSAECAGCSNGKCHENRPASSGSSNSRHGHH